MLHVFYTQAMRPPLRKNGYHCSGRIAERDRQTASQRADNRFRQERPSFSASERPTLGRELPSVNSRSDGSFSPIALQKLDIRLSTKMPIFNIVAMLSNPVVAYSLRYLLFFHSICWQLGLTYPSKIGAVFPRHHLLFQ